MPFLTQGKTNWKYILIVVILAVIVGGGIFGYYQWMAKREEAKMPEEKVPEKVIKLYPRSAELFEACLRSYHPELEEAELKELSEEELKNLKIFQEIYSVVSDREVEKVVEGINSEIRMPEGTEPEEIEKIIITAKDFETKLEKGYSLPEWLVFNLLCRNNLMDESLRPKEYNKICEENPSCCDLPVPKDIESAKDLAKTMMECQSGESFEITDIKKLKYGYSIIQGEAPTEWGVGYYLTDSGCLTHCYMPFAYIEGIKGRLYQEKMAELEFERLPEEIKTKVREFENKIESLYTTAISEKNPEICEEIKREVEKVESVLEEKTIDTSKWEFQAMMRKSAYGYEDEYYQPCIKIIAVKLNDESLCNRLPSPAYCRRELFLYYTNLCKEIVFDVIAKEEYCRGWASERTEEENELCWKELFNRDRKEDCLKEIALETEDMELCKKILDKDCQNELAIKLNKPEECVWSSCYQELAVKNNDVELCKKASDEAWCVAEVAYKKGDIIRMKLCDDYFGISVKNKYERERCYIHIATKVGEEGYPKLCERLFTAYQWACYQKVAVIINDVELCGENEKCITEIAVNTNNSDLCKMLTSEYWKKQCYEKLGVEPPLPAYLGVKYAIITPALQDIQGLSVSYGALLEDLIFEEPPILPDSPADKAGLKEGDVILEINGEKVTQDNHIGKILERYIAGEEIILKILRQEKETEIKVVLGGMKKELLKAKFIEELSRMKRETWRTFRNEGYQYKLKYPGDWIYIPRYCSLYKYKIEPPSYCPAGISTGADLCYEVEFEELSVEEEKKLSPWSIYIYHGYSYSSIFSSIEKITNLKGTEKEIQATVQNLPNLTVSFFLASPKYEQKWVIVQGSPKDNPKKFIEIYTVYNHELDENLKILNQMLSTFRFLE